ncbi:MAG: nucleotidyltransferase [Candidatus Omnitrophica bacterium]|nr:nucleotidyltransferase [Candidatus Omnitrophota bacterium]
MNKKLSLEPLYSALKDLVGWLQEGNSSGIIIGGVAVSLLSQPRTTRDIDALAFLDEAEWPAFLESGKKFGFQPRQKDALKFAQQNQVLLVRHQPTLTDVDVSFGALPFEREVLKRAKKIKISNFTISLPTPEDLIIMKAVAHRPIDLEDIRSILEVNPNLDFKRIKRWVKEFAEVLEMPEIWTDLKKLLPKK